MMKFFVCFVFVLMVLVLVVSQLVCVDVYGYIDENGFVYFVVECLDDCYVLFMKGVVVVSKGDDKVKDDSVIVLLVIELFDVDVYFNVSKCDVFDNVVGMCQCLVCVVLQYLNVLMVELLICQVVSKYGIDFVLVKVVIVVEFGFNLQVVLFKGVIGLMQVILDIGVCYGVIGDVCCMVVQKLVDLKMNIIIGVCYLSDLLCMFLGNLEFVLVVYNVGEGVVQKYGNDILFYVEIQNYVKMVLQFYCYYNLVVVVFGLMNVSVNGVIVMCKLGCMGWFVCIEFVLDLVIGVVMNLF